MKNIQSFDINTKTVALTATFTALVFVATIVFQLAIVATNGYFNLGESMVYLAALIGGPFIGLIAGGFGSALADAATGFGSFAPGTLIIKGLEGFIVGYLFISLKDLNKRKIKYIYSIFTIVFISISIIITTPSLFTILTTLDFSSFSSVLSDFGSVSFDFSFDLYYPEGNELFVRHSFVIMLTGLFFIFISLLLSALLWISYYRLGEKSVMILSCSVGGFVLVVGYFLYEVFILYYVPTVAFAEVPFNIAQSLVGMAIAIPAVSYLYNLGIIEESSQN